MSRALLVVDVQSGLVDKKLFAKDAMLAAIAEAIAASRGSGDIVVFIQHCGGAVKRGAPGWELYPGLDRRSGDPLVLKEHGNAFEETELAGILAKAGVEEILVCGLVSHGCVRATCRGGAALGFRVRLLKGGHSNWAADAEKKIAAVEAELVAAGIPAASLAEWGRP